MPILPSLQENNPSIYYGMFSNSSVGNIIIHHSGQSENLHADGQSLERVPILFPLLGGRRRVNDRQIQHTPTPGA
jgi:hypothetical protein